MTPSLPHWPDLPGLIFWDAHQVAHCLRGSMEHVLMDVREEGVFAQGHLFYAASLPLSRLELRLPQCVPRRDTAIVLVADDFSSIERALAVLHQGGYRQVHRDPFDRLLAAQAELEGLQLVSLDPALATFPCRLLW
jgi:hypothetical protein